MSEAINPARKEDTTRTGSLKVSCGGPAWGPHPKVFLTMEDDGNGNPSNVVCPYCSHVFVYDAGLAAKAAPSH